MLMLKAVHAAQPMNMRSLLFQHLAPQESMGRWAAQLHAPDPLCGFDKLINRTRGVKIMLHWALVFLVIAIIAAVMGFTGIAGAATNIAWILFVVGLVVALVLFLKRKV